jgi:hypothetical protein
MSGICVVNLSALLGVLSRRAVLDGDGDSSLAALVAMRFG